MKNIIPSHEIMNKIILLSNNNNNNNNNNHSNTSNTQNTQANATNISNRHSLSLNSQQSSQQSSQLVANNNHNIKYIELKDIINNLLIINNYELNILLLLINIATNDLNSNLNKKLLSQVRDTTFKLDFWVLIM